MAEPLTHVPEDDAVSDTDTQTMVAPAFQAPSGAATAPGVPFLNPTTNTEWLQAFSLDSPPSEEWASVITQSSSLPHWLSPMIENYASLRHLFTESTDVQGFWSVEVFDRLGVSEPVEMDLCTLACSTSGASYKCDSNTGRGCNSCAATARFTNAG